MYMHIYTYLNAYREREREREKERGREKEKKKMASTPNDGKVMDAFYQVSLSLIFVLRPHKSSPERRLKPLEAPLERLPGFVGQLSLWEQKGLLG